MTPEGCHVNFELHETMEFILSWPIGPDKEILFA